MFNIIVDDAIVVYTGASQSRGRQVAAAATAADALSGFKRKSKEPSYHHKLRSRRRVYNSAMSASNLAPPRGAAGYT